ncbi:MAG: ATP-binding protein [Fusobacterium mortiferum]|nr:ATP-binding protein [Fusobacterium mortiferum]MDY5980472.1 ATP-binding protein [Fusobacterium mortiferum]
MRKKFLTVCFLLIFIISLSIGLIVNKRVKDNYIEMEVKMGLSQVNLINMYFSRRTEIETPLYRLAQVLENKSEYRVTFVNEEGIPVADSQDNSIILESNGKKYNIKEKNGNFPYYKIVKSLSKDVEVLEIYTEIFNLNGKKIRLVFSKELKFLKDFQKNIIITILLGIVIAGVISFILSLISITRIITPILSLTKIARKVALGNFRERIFISSGDEIEELGRTFNFMSEKIESLLNIVEEKAKNLQNIVDNLQAAIIVTDIDGDIILINKYAEKEFFLKEEKKNIFYQENFIEFRKIIENKIKNKDRKEEKIICKDKVYKLKLDFIYEKELQVLLVIEDITAIEKTESLRREFVSNASHELKTPITIISGFIETIKLGHIKDEKQLNHFIEIMEKEVKRLALLTDNLLHLSRAEKILAENNEEKTLNLRLLLEEIRKSFFNIAERKKIEIEIKADDKEIKTKLSNEWFRTVIGNLIDNSIKYSNNDSKIELIGYIKGEYLSITVKDEGIGIPKEELENIFRRFYRVDKSRNRKIEGNGLGLAIVKNMVYSINGKINIESEVGLGTKIVLEFPLL